MVLCQVKLVEKLLVTVFTVDVVHFQAVVVETFNRGEQGFTQVALPEICTTVWIVSTVVCSCFSA